jgi:Protein of unknown function (DUF1364)
MTPANLLPKVRSRDLLGAIQGMPCTLRISSLYVGHRCAPDATVVPCHLPDPGKGMGAKTSDLFVAAGCQHCHDLLDGRDNRIHWINDHYPRALHERIRLGLQETQSRLYEAGIIQVRGDRNNEDEA